MSIDNEIHDISGENKDGVCNQQIQKKHKARSPLQAHRSSSNGLFDAGAIHGDTGRYTVLSGEHEGSVRPVVTRSLARTASERQTAHKETVG